MEHKISSNFNPSKMHTDDTVMVEAFLRTSREVLDGALETYSMDQVRGGLMMLEKYMEIKEQVCNSVQHEQSKP